jgi:NAD(P)H-hydrate repair Nnr-like enzyme with NAD(P)H-hydrate dehydratase domain
MKLKQGPSWTVPELSCLLSISMKHAAAGEMVKENMGDAGMLASDLLPVLPKVIKRLKAEI